MQKIVDEPEDILNIEHIKEIIKQIVKLSIPNFKPLTLEQRDAFEDMNKVSFALFSARKLQRQDFTVLNNSKLKKIRIEEDADGINEDDLMMVENILKDNTEAFHELVASCYISKKAKSFATEDQIFYINLVSRHTSQEEDIFFVNKNNEFFVFTDRVTDIPLEQFVSDCFGNINKRLHMVLGLIKKSRALTHEQKQNRIYSYFKNCYSVDDHQLIKGAITFFDFLGWKGLWQKEGNALQDLGDLIKDFNLKLVNYTKEMIPYCGTLEISKLLSISDTIVIFTPQMSCTTSQHLLEMHSFIAKYVIEQAVKKQYPIRGAITFGEYSIKNNVMIGPGIDECASWHEICDWIGVHFTPSAQFLIESTGKKDNNIIEYDKIPTKNGVPKVKYCVDWIVEDKHFHELVEKARSITPEIASKYLNTYYFLHRLKKGDTNG